MKKPPAKRLQRAEAIMKVRCGLMTVSQAAAQLGVSRKTYYQWEQRGLSGLLEGVSDQKAGRPKKPVQQLELEKQLAETLRENQRLRQQVALKDLASKIDIATGVT